MYDPKRMIPLTRRLIDNYLMFGLACLFLCVALSLALAWRGVFTTYVPLAAIGPMVVLALGAFVLRRTLWLNSQIEQQLQQVAFTSPDGDLDLAPIPHAAPAAAGWNNVLERIGRVNTFANIEARLSESLGGVSQRQIDRALDALPDGLAVTDQAGAVSVANSAFKVLVNDDPLMPLDGKLVIELLSAKWGRDVQHIPTKLKQPTAPIVFEMQRSEEIAGGVLRLARYPLQNSDGEVTGHIWSARDITQQKLAEEMRNQFVFTATHELRTPLGNIVAYAETLTLHEVIDPEQQKQFCNTIHSEAVRLIRFVDELLNVSQMEAGALCLSRYETDVARMLGEVVTHVQPQIEEKQIEFEFKVPPKLPQLTIDKDKIVAALVNLLGNAVKYTPDQGRVQFSVEASNDQIEFHVEDSGIGIGPAELPRVFDKFFRSADKRVTNLSGNGLGLAFTKEVARLHDGDVTVHSELNKGSKFSMFLPI